MHNKDKLLLYFVIITINLFQLLLLEQSNPTIYQLTNILKIQLSIYYRL